MRQVLRLAPVLLLAACTVGPDFVPPKANAPDSYAAPGDAPPPPNQTLVDKPADADWWKQFHAPALDALMAAVTEANPPLAAARARVAEAEESDLAAEAALLPQVSLLGQVGAQNYSLYQKLPFNLTLPPFEYYAAGPSASYPLDLFGGGKREVERAAALTDYQHRELDAATLSLFANLAAEAIRNAAAKAQIANLQSVIAGDERDVALVQATMDAGSATRTQLLSVQSQLADDRTLLPDLVQQESVSRHALAILMGKAPAGWTAPAFALDDFTLPTEIPVVLPSQLIHRRPDILAAEAQLHMASAAIGVATANLYPQVNLSAQAIFEALTPATLAAGVIKEWAAAAALSQPVFDGGKLDAQRRAAIDDYQAALADYQQVVLGAFRDIADGLQALATDADRVNAESEAARTAADSLDLSRRSFAAGNSGVLDVIDAERRSAQAQLGLSRARAQRLLDTVQLYVALGGAPMPVTPVTLPTPDAPCCSY